MAVLALSAVGCSESPSFHMRWAIDGVTLTDHSQCSEHGILEVQVLTIDPLGRVATVQEFPCFGEYWRNPDITAPGPALQPGQYAVRVRGVSRNYTGWVDEVELEAQTFAAQQAGEEYLSLAYDRCRPHPPAGAPIPDRMNERVECRPEYYACDCKEVTVVEDAETFPVLDTFDLGSPPQCIDGVDNDRDGLIDAQDTACTGAFSLADENADVLRTTFDVATSLLSKNPNATCNGLRFAINSGTLRIAVEVDGTELGSDESCSLEPIRFIAELPSGPHDVRVRLLEDQTGEDVATPFQRTIEVSEDVGGVFKLDADFPATAFTNPVTGPTSMSLAFASDPADPLRTRLCAPNNAREGTLQITDMRLALLDGRGEPLPGVTLDDGTPLDGQTLVPCDGGQLGVGTLTWGDFLVRVEGLSAEGEVCFSNTDAPTPLAPNVTAQLYAPRVYPIPDSCRDCASDADCASPNLCEAGLCIQPCTTDAQCTDGDTVCDPVARRCVMVDDAGAQ